jgi:hypothetical protein
MSQLAPQAVRDAALGFAVAAGSALLMAFILASAGSPSGFRGRLQQLETQARQTQDLLRPKPSDDLYPADAICQGDPTMIGKAFRNSLTTFAAQASLNLETLDVGVEPPTSDPSALTPVRLRFTATGPYEGAIMFLQSLSRQRPEIFADAVDLTSKTSNVTISFSGRVFCSV